MRFLSLLWVGLCAAPPQAQEPSTVPRSAGMLFASGLYAEEGVGDCDNAIALYSQILEQFADDHVFAPRALLRRGICHLKLGHLDDAEHDLTQVKASAASHAELAEAAERELLRCRRARATRALNQSIEQIRATGASEQRSADQVEADVRAARAAFDREFGSPAGLDDASLAQGRQADTDLPPVGPRLRFQQLRDEQRRRREQLEGRGVGQDEIEQELARSRRQFLDKVPEMVREDSERLVVQRAKQLRRLGLSEAEVQAEVDFLRSLLRDRKLLETMVRLLEKTQERLARIERALDHGDERKK